MTSPAQDQQSWTRSTCPYCGVGCGVLMRRGGPDGLEVKGDPDHPANRGRLCSKGAALAETTGLEGRLRAPRLHGADTDWDSALDLVATRFRETIAAHGPDSVAFYVSGQLLTEDYYVANKLMKGFIGSANIDTNSRLCMASSVAGHKRAFGSDTVPGTYEDIDEADLVVLVGSNLAWCHPVLHQRLLAARAARGTRIVVIDPRHTASCDTADLHLKLRIGSDVALFNHLLSRIAQSAALNPDFLRNVNGLDETLAAAQDDNPDATGLPPEEIDRFCRMWIETPRVVTLYSQGVNQSAAGADKVNAILNCHLATGRIGRPGSGPFSVTGQPNAMGGREVGGLANMLACHLDLDTPDHRAIVQDHWAAPTLPAAPGLKAVDMFEAIHSGQIKALWIIHTNPAVSMPDADRVAQAIARCPFTVVSDISAETDTARLADVLLPAAAWGEKSGTVTNSDRTISRQRALRPPPGSARPDWQILCDVGRRMGWPQAFAYDSPAAIFRDYAALSGKAAALGRDFDISALSALEDDAYDTLLPGRWPRSAERSGGRFFADGRFYHADGKAQMIPVQHRPPVAKRSPRYPFRLNTGRIRDQWHTMTRTGLSPRLSAHLAEPYVDLHPEDAARLAIKPADLVQLSSPHGRALLRARITDDGQPGTVFAPIHWTAETAPAARIDHLVAPVVDPVSGQPESKASVVAVSRFEARWYGFAVSATPLDRDTLEIADYWARARTPGGWRLELAGRRAIADWDATARRLFDLPQADVQLVSDPARGTTRLAYLHGGCVQAALFVAPQPVAVMRDYLTGVPGTAAATVLTGRAPVDQPDPGPILCSCFSVGVNSILTAIETGGLMTVDDVGAALQAGTNCGSCKPEIAALLARIQVQEAAE
ncbi:nitrate reductase [Epibacterium sp. MM17-32]|uniref:nitrate reductase n=1 Tax=Epibacterium sp. MM17-32 TaxID=2917734 RepID=UPI001EF680E1|nr:nitrate reductase [Epibacterium sp. MM17-32]MCG7630056.1 nitrate reductase [Epibacterium sp. MM17-32]